VSGRRKASTRVKEKLLARKWALKRGWWPGESVLELGTRSERASAGWEGRSGGKESVSRKRTKKKKQNSKRTWRMTEEGEHSEAWKWADPTQKRSYNSTPSRGRKKKKNRCKPEGERGGKH